MCNICISRMRVIYLQAFLMKAAYFIEKNRFFGFFMEQAKNNSSMRVIQHILCAISFLLTFQAAEYKGIFITWIVFLRIVKRQNAHDVTRKNNTLYA